MEDRALLGSNPSAIRNSGHGAVILTVSLLCDSYSEIKAINPSSPQVNCD
jgi:hypothetical protein